MTRQLPHQTPIASGCGSLRLLCRTWLSSLLLALALFISAFGSLAAQPAGSIIFDYTGPIPVCPGTMTITVREFYVGFNSNVSFKIFMVEPDGSSIECNMESCYAYIINNEWEMVEPFANNPSMYRGVKVRIGVNNPSTAWRRFRLCFYINGQMTECQEFPVKNIDATDMSGPAGIPCCSEDPVTYCVDAPEGADSYRWDLPAGWTEVSRSGNCITVRPTKGSSGQILGRPYYDECNREGRPFGVNITRTPCQATMNPTLIPCGQTTGGAVSASMPGGVAPLTYSWTKDGAPFGGNSTSLSDLSAGTYAVTITDADGCTANGQVVLEDPTTYPDLDVTFTTKSYYYFRFNSFCWIKITPHVTGGKPPYSYNWYTPGHTMATYDGPTPATYKVTITDARGCSITRVLEYPNCVRSPLVGFGDVNVVPNPTTGTFGVTYALDAAADVEFNVSNYLGNTITSRTVSHQTSGSFQENFDISNNPPGPYFVNLITAGSPPVTVRVDLQ